MPRGKSIDKEIKNYYEMFKDFKSDDKGELKDVYNYTNNIIEKYLKGNQELICKLCKITNIKQEDLRDMILKDAWYHSWHWQSTMPLFCVTVSWKNMRRWMQRKR